MKNLSYEEMVRAMLTDDSRYDGTFYVCVKSTRIYCLPSCKAKQPLLQNVVFYPTREQAVKAGFRGCKRCRAEFFPDVAPPWLEKILALLRRDVRSKIREQDLADIAGVDISTIRRYFKAYLQTTPIAFHRRVRLEYATSLITRGADYLTAAYECGFDSVSGFRDAFARHYGFSPGKLNGDKQHRLPSR
jgi:AraC family transcriptional regulator of adaptative response/methylated-DNA-[protein]-cysteine methyltransferase